MATSEVTAVEVTMPVSGSHTWTDCHGDDFVVEEVQHRAIVHEGKYIRTAVVFGTKLSGGRSNASLYASHDEFPAWLPSAPAGWEDVAGAIRRSAQRADMDAAYARTNPGGW